MKLFNSDCLAAMKEMPDKCYELAIVDPPYGLGDRLTDGGQRKNLMLKYKTSYEQKRWDVAPDNLYFEELRRVSVNQIIWGGNYFPLPPTRCVLCWDKNNKLTTMSEWEMAWTSFDRPAKMFSFRSVDEDRFHPTQKPVKLYEWLLKNYAKPGDKILDTHLGSGSSAIAAYNLGYDFTGYEIDKDYFDAAQKRIQHHIAHEETGFGIKHVTKDSRVGII